jgi:hypothetical protein
VLRKGLEDPGRAVFERRLLTNDAIAERRRDSKIVLGKSSVGTAPALSVDSAAFTSRDVQMAVRRISNENPALGALSWWDEKNVNFWNAFVKAEPAFLNTLPGETYAINLPLGSAFDENGQLSSVDLAAATFAFAEMMKSGKGGELLVNFYSTGMTPAARTRVSATLANVQLVSGQGRVRFGLTTLSSSDNLVRGIESGLDPKLKLSGMSVGFESTRPIESLGDVADLLANDKLRFFQVALPSIDETLSSATLFGAGTMGLDMYDALMARFGQFAQEIDVVQLPGGIRIVMAKPRKLTPDLRALLTRKRSVDSAA